MDILVRQEFSKQDIKLAETKRAAYRPSKATTGASNVLDMADLGKTVTLCPDHTKQFATKPVLSKYGYRRHDDYPEVQANCDYCGLWTRCALFQHVSVFGEVLKTKAQRRADRDYATICTG